MYFMMMFPSTNIIFRAHRILIVIAVSSSLYFVNTTPRMYNENWILHPSRQESHTSGQFYISNILNFFENLWSFDKKKTLIPEINANELIKRVGLLPSDDKSESNWIIHPSRAEHQFEEIDGKNDIDSNKEVDTIIDTIIDYYQPDINDNNAELWSESIPNTIRNGIDTLSSGVINATQQVKDQLEMAQISIIASIKQALNLPDAENKLPKE